jgi:hypothetical protein
MQNGMLQFRIFINYTTGFDRPVSSYHLLFSTFTSTCLQILKCSCVHTLLLCFILPYQELDILLLSVSRFLSHSTFANICRIQYVFSTVFDIQCLILRSNNVTFSFAFRLLLLLLIIISK